MNHLNKYTQRFGKKLFRDEAFVLVSEEFGYRYWFWFPEVSQKKLVSIWKNTERIDKFNFQKVLPGKFILAGGANVEWSMKEEWFYFLYGNRTTWIADIFDDCDSLLITTTPKRYIHHKGRYKANMELLRDIDSLTHPIDITGDSYEKY
jgi:hypothetical protein